jgi:hypothetical protein
LKYVYVFLILHHCHSCFVVEYHNFQNWASRYPTIDWGKQDSKFCHPWFLIILGEHKGCPGNSECRVISAGTKMIVSKI